MKVLLTGHNGYVGSVMAGRLQAAGHEIHGLDAYFYEHCSFGPPTPGPPASRGDLRDTRARALVGYDAVIHLAALSNDPLGNLNAAATYDINHRASVRLAQLAKAAGVPRFLFASSCSLYGVAGEAELDEDAPFNPITPYGESKVLVERDLEGLADEDFSPTFLRNATVYGPSPQLRLDVVVNNLLAHAVTTGRVLIQSDGTPWRPLVHIEDMCLAFSAVLEAPRELIHGQAFNVGRSTENYRVRDLADMVRAAVPGSEIVYAADGGPDPRSYRVNCDKLPAVLPAFRAAWTVTDGILQLRDALATERFSAADLSSDRYFRIRRIRTLQQSGMLGEDLRWLSAPADTRREAGS